MVQLLEIYHATQEGCIFFGDMYNELKGENLLVRGNLIVIWWTLSHWVNHYAAAE